MAKRILVLLGHPGVGSYCAAIAETYAAEAQKAGHSVRILRVGELPIDLVPPSYKADTELAGWVKTVQEEIAWSNHWVIVAPMWCGGTPAALKSLFDRVLLPGFAFRYIKGPVPDKLLTGRSATFLMTSDTPSFWFDFILRRPLFNQMKLQVLELCGFKPIRQIMFSPILHSTQAQREKWLKRVAALGAGGL